MKTLQKLFPEFQIVEIRYKGSKRKGFDIIDSERNILAQLEPISNRFKDKWFITIKGSGHGIAYTQTIGQAAQIIKAANIKAGYTGFKLK